MIEAVGHTIESAGPLCSVGECCEIFDGFGHKHLVEVIGFRGNHVLSMPLESSDGIRYGDPITGMGIAPQIEVGDALMGRVLNAMGEPIDNGRRPIVNTLMPLTSCRVVPEVFAGGVDFGSGGMSSLSRKRTA